MEQGRKPLENSVVTPSVMLMRACGNWVCKLGYTTVSDKTWSKSARLRPRTPGNSRRIRLIPGFWSNATHPPNNARRNRADWNLILFFLDRLVLANNLVEPPPNTFNFSFTVFAICYMALDTGSEVIVPK